MHQIKYPFPALFKGNRNWNTHGKESVSWGINYRQVSAEQKIQQKIQDRNTETQVIKDRDYI